MDEARNFESYFLKIKQAVSITKLGRFFFISISKRMVIKVCFYIQHHLLESI